MGKVHIPFNRVDIQGNELEYIKQAIASGHISGDGAFTQKCNYYLEKELGVKKTLFTTSCTHALEMTAILLDIKPGDEVIIPSFTFVSTVNAFVMRGAKPIFIDLRPDTLNMDEFRISSLLDKLLEIIMFIELGLKKIGIKLPFGGSLLLLASKKK